MSWIRIDDLTFYHPQAAKAGTDMWVWVACISHSRRYKTNGFVPESAVPTLAGGVKRLRAKVKRLVTFGLLDVVEGGYRVVLPAMKNIPSARARSNRPRPHRIT